MRFTDGTHTDSQTVRYKVPVNQWCQLRPTRICVCSTHTHMLIVTGRGAQVTVKVSLSLGSLELTPDCCIMCLSLYVCLHEWVSVGVCVRVRDKSCHAAVLSRLIPTNPQSNNMPPLQQHMGASNRCKINHVLYYPFILIHAQTICVCLVKANRPVCVRNIYISAIFGFKIQLWELSFYCLQVTISLQNITIL